jgi:hypothetical protein
VTSTMAAIGLAVSTAATPNKIIIWCAFPVRAGQRSGGSLSPAGASRRYAPSSSTHTTHTNEWSV